MTENSLTWNDCEQSFHEASGLYARRLLPALRIYICRRQKKICIERPSTSQHGLTGRALVSRPGLLLQLAVSRTADPWQEALLSPRDSCRLSSALGIYTAVVGVALYSLCKLLSLFTLPVFDPRNSQSLDPKGSSVQRRMFRWPFSLWQCIPCPRFTSEFAGTGYVRP